MRGKKTCVLGKKLWFSVKKHAFTENQGKTILLWKKGSCFVFFRSPEHRARSQELGARGPEPGALSPGPGARSPELRSAEPGARSPEAGAGAWSTEPGARSPDPEPRTLDPGPRTPDPAPRIRDPGPRSSEPGARSPRARAASGPRFVSPWVPARPRALDFFSPLVPARPRALDFFTPLVPAGAPIGKCFFFFDRRNWAAYPPLVRVARAEGAQPELGKKAQFWQKKQRF